MGTHSGILTTGCGLAKCPASANREILYILYEFKDVEPGDGGDGVVEVIALSKLELFGVLGGDAVK